MAHPFGRKPHDDEPDYISGEPGDLRLRNGQMAEPWEYGEGAPPLVTRIVAQATVAGLFAIIALGIYLSVGGRLPWH